MVRGNGCSVLLLVICLIVIFQNSSVTAYDNVTYTESEDGLFVIAAKDNSRGEIALAMLKFNKPYPPNNCILVPEPGLYVRLVLTNGTINKFDLPIKVDPANYCPYMDKKYLEVFLVNPNRILLTYFNFNGQTPTVDMLSSNQWNQTVVVLDYWGNILR